MNKVTIYQWFSTFLSLDAVAKYLSSCDQQHDQIIRECRQVFLSTLAIHENNGSVKINDKIKLFIKHK
jgi:hypothetical protein